MQPIIAAESVSKIYRAGKVEVPALRKVSFVVPPGEFVSIVGPSGSGKSTLFYVLGGLTRATSGSVLIDGVDFAKLTDSRRTVLRKTKIGFVFQKFNLLPTLTARGNIEIAREIAGSHSAQDGELLAHLAEMLGIAGRLDHRPAELSGGEQQRVSIARAFVNHPPLLLCDEPTGNLDPETSIDIMRLLYRINRTGTTVLVASHDHVMVDRMQRRVLELSRGRIVRDEATGLFARDETTREFAHRMRSSSSGDRPPTV